MPPGNCKAFQNEAVAIGALHVLVSVVADPGGIHLPKKPAALSESDAHLLTNFQRRVVSAEVAFVERFTPYIERLGRRRCEAHHLLPQDLDDVVQETYRLLLDDTLTRFEPARCTAIQFVGGQVYNAARIVAAASRSGTPTVPWPIQHRTDAKELHDDLRATPAQDGIGEAEFRLLISDLSKDVDDASKQIFAMIHLESAGVLEVAARLDLTRFQVHRRLRAIYAHARSTLAA